MSGNECQRSSNPKKGPEGPLELQIEEFRSSTHTPETNNVKGCPKFESPCPLHMLLVPVLNLDGKMLMSVE